MANTVDTTFPASTEVLAAVRALLRDFCQEAGCGEECRDDLVLAVNEACMNIIQHAYGFATDCLFRLQLYVRDGVIVARLLDNGTPVTEAELRPRELDDLRPGGLGVRFMREVTDTLNYLPPPDGFTNLLQLTKRIY